MTTTTAPIAVTCPDWCTVPADEHVADLWEMEGNCIHGSADIEIADPTGYRDAHLDAPRLHSPITLRLSSQARPSDGRETATPTFYIGDDEMSVEQALAVADSIRSTVEAYRSAGGTA